ncbi:MAG: acyl-CoA dehydrogenase family protein [Hyphomicrobiales bacterium]|nr:acyl-CoA dehydrogenase family protein [Hyphomicrobiales bacterium]
MRSTFSDLANQPPPFVDVDLYGSDLPLRSAVAVNDGEDTAALAQFGRRWGTVEMFDLGRQANEHPPQLHRLDARGFRLDFVEYHPAYHRLMSESVGAALHVPARLTSVSRASNVTRAARFYMAAQVETGHLCPLTMTRAALATLAAEPQLLAEIEPRIAGCRYDPAFRSWHEKSGITLGMGMTERQGGTDVRTNTTRAVPAGDGYVVTGEKWFMSAPMSDAFLILAQAPGGLTCFLLPRFRPDGAVNGVRFERLKDKLGNRSNASSEVAFEDAFAWRVGEEGRGVRTIIDMVQLTRVDCAIASAGLMRMSLAQALHHARHRVVFQRHLVDQPVMRAVLAELALEVEAAVALVFRLCRALDLAVGDAEEAAGARLLTPVVKYWVCKLAPAFCYEAMECLGGNGYVEESLLPRLYREAPVNAIWEGSGNVMCLDVLRAFARERDAVDAVLSPLAAETADLPGGTTVLTQMRRALAAGEAHARIAVSQLATLAAAAALKSTAPSEITLAFARTYLQGTRSPMYGANDLAPAEACLLLQRALP